MQCTRTTSACILPVFEMMASLAGGLIHQEFPVNLRGGS